MRLRKMIADAKAADRQIPHPLTSLDQKCGAPEDTISLSILQYVSHLPFGKALSHDSLVMHYNPAFFYCQGQL